ncbi:MAG: hypothetical protein ACJ8IQ_00685, partial [Chthoniobacterales bacterium]
NHSLHHKIKISKQEDRGGHEAFIHLRNAEANRFVGEKGRLSRLLDRPAASRGLENVRHAQAHVGKATEISEAVKRCILDAFFHFDELNDLIGKGFVKDTLWIPLHQMPLRVVPGAREFFPHYGWRLFSHRTHVSSQAIST